MVVEIHVPLLPAPDARDGGYPFAWIDEVEGFLFVLEDQGDMEVFDDGEENGDVYVFFIAGADEETLLAVASRVATLSGVPAGTFAAVSADDAERPGLGRRVALPPSAT
ncbi:hypothetical protein ABZX77_26200 [Streptomyces sp. NPDC004237]|uniref:hypothetical protein n=1 Tax=Streptomyces sp. NPDC004237 TaxID=3154455 RepID=UPI0033B843A0